MGSATEAAPSARLVPCIYGLDQGSSQAFDGERGTSMGAADVVAGLDREICGGDLRKAAEYLADDFQFVGAAPEPLGRDEALGLWQTLRAAMPDFNHNMKNQREA